MTLHDATTDTVIVTPTPAPAPVETAYGSQAVRFGPGLIVLAVGWLVVAAAMALIGGAVGVGILQAVT